MKFVKNLDNHFRFCFFGATRSGKTVAARQILHVIQQYRKNRVFVVDTKWEFDDIKDFHVSDLNFGAVMRKIREVRIDGVKYEKPRDLAEFCAAMTWHFRPAMLYLEEIAAFIDVNEHLPLSHPLVYKILQQGAAESRNICVATQKVSQCHKAFVDQASDVFLFAVKPRECEAFERVMSLPKGSIHFNLPDELYCFYHVSCISEPEKYRPLKIKKKTGRPSGKNTEKKNINESEKKNENLDVE